MRLISGAGPSQRRIARAQAQASADDLETIKLMIQAEVPGLFQLARARYPARRPQLHISGLQQILAVDPQSAGWRSGSDLRCAQSLTVLKTTEAQLPAVTLQRAQFEHAAGSVDWQPASTFHVSERSLSTALL